MARARAVAVGAAISICSRGDRRGIDETWPGGQQYRAQEKGRRTGVLAIGIEARMAQRGRYRRRAGGQCPVMKCRRPAGRPI